MSANIIEGAGTKLSYSTTSNGTFTELDAVVSLDLPEISGDEVETYHLGSTLKTTRKGSLCEPGELSGKVYFDPDSTTHQLLLTLAKATTEYYWKITLSDVTPTVYTIQGYISKFKITGIEVNKNVEADFTIKAVSLLA